MPYETTHDDSMDSARAALRQVMMTVFCDTLHESRLAPMMVMALAAEALGSIYQEVADAHRHEDACPCGWRPSLERDIEVLQVAVAQTAQPAPVTDLRLARVAGRA